MKKLVTNTLVAVLIAWTIVATVACSSAQKQAETKLTADEAQCAAQCVVTDALASGTKSDGAIASDCTIKCGLDILTNTDEQKALMTIIAGTRAAAAALHKPDAGL